MVFVGRRRKLRLDDLARDCDRVVILKMQLARGGSDDAGRSVEPRISLERLAIDCDRGRRLRGLRRCSCRARRCCFEGLVISGRCIQELKTKWTTNQLSGSDSRC